jgi:hypothetical protein
MDCAKWIHLEPRKNKLNGFLFGRLRLRGCGGVNSRWKDAMTLTTPDPRSRKRQEQRLIMLFVSDTLGEF